MQSEGSELRAIIYGVPGAGKTRLAASVCKHDSFWPVVILDCFGGQTSYKDYYADGMRKPYILKVSSFAHLNLAWQLINDKAGVRAKFGWDFVGQPRTIIIDQLSDLQRYAITAVVRAEEGLPSEPGVILPKMEWPGYNRLQLSFLDSTGFFTNIPGVHTIAIAHEEIDNGVATILLDGKSKDAIAGRSLFVGRLVPVSRCSPQLLDQIVSARGGKTVVNNVLFCVPGQTWAGKNQYSKTQYYADPDYTMFLDLLEEVTY